MKTIILSVKDTGCIVQHVGLDALMDEMIARLFGAFKMFDDKNTVIPPRAGLSYSFPNMGLIEWMPLLRQKDRVVIKVVGYHPTNPALLHLPTILSTVSAYDTASGHLIGLMDGTFLTALRTGAASAVASKLMASPQSKILGLIGCGAQAVTQLHALSRTFDLEKVLVYDIDPAVSLSFLRRVACLNLKNIEIIVASLDRLVGSADIICTATSVEIGQGPVFEDIELKPWVHINAIGSDFPGKIEVPRLLLKRSFVCPDFRAQAVKEGECQQLAPEDIGPDLFELVQQQEQYRFIWQEMTVFDSTGWALEDQVAMNMLLDYATELGVGTFMQIESISADVRNPYHFATDTHDRIPTSIRESRSRKLNFS
ncbi:MAG: ornithine cyclodeaminase family protein [Xenococcaceae cyanobacterium]